MDRLTWALFFGVVLHSNKQTKNPETSCKTKKKNLKV